MTNLVIKEQTVDLIAEAAAAAEAPSTLCEHIIALIGSISIAITCFVGQTGGNIGSSSSSSSSIHDDK